MTKTIAEVVVDLPLEGPFDYHLEPGHIDQVFIGQRVSVPFRANKKIGFVVGLKQKSSLKKLKDIYQVLDSGPVLSESFLKMTRDFAHYYGCSWGEAITTSLPTFLKMRHQPVVFSLSCDESTTDSTYQVHLVHDKGFQDFQEVLSNHVQKTLGQGKGAIILVPEVSDIDLYISFFKKKIQEEVVILDKRLSPLKEIKNWILLKEGKIRVVIGTRSAVFAPVHRLGLIAMIEEENSSYKQDQSPFYHARQVAMMRADHEHCNLLFIAQTPSVELFHLAQKKKIILDVLETKSSCETQIIDLLNYKPRKNSLIFLPLQFAMEKALDQRGKVLLLMNQKGFGSFGICSSCQYIVKCPRCDIPLTYLYHLRKIICRHCHYKIDRPTFCPSCQGPHLSFSGFGIEKLQSEAARLFPSARVDCYEKTSTQHPRDFDILVSTQAILHVREKISFDLVAVVHADQELNRLGLQSGHNALALFMQLKYLARKKFILQTRLKENYCVAAVMKDDLSLFYHRELELRKELKFPPFWHLIEIICRSPKKESAWEQANAIYQGLCEHKGTKNVEILEPQADFIARLRDQYRFAILIKSKEVFQAMAFIQSVLKSVKHKGKTLVTINVDP